MAYTANIIPAMTSNTAPSGVASASSIYSYIYPAWKAFDHGEVGNSSPWRPTGTTGQLGYQFPVARVVTRYAITTWGASGISRAPKTWTFQGSADGVNWETLDAQTNIMDTEWATINGVRRVFDFANVTAYARYRLDISASNGTYLAVLELEMMETLTLPTVWTTLAINGIRARHAHSGGVVTGGDIIARGVCWSTSAGPTVTDSHTTDGTGAGTFTSALNGLLPDTTYHVRAYATNAAGTAYGAELYFTTDTLEALRVMAFQPDISTDDGRQAVAKFGVIILTPDMAPYVAALKAINPDILCLVRSDACESWMASGETGRLAWFGDMSPKWLLRQVGAKLTADMSAIATSFTVDQTSLTYAGTWPPSRWSAPATVWGDGSDDGVTLASSTVTLFQPGQYIVVDNEVMYCTGVDYATGVLSVDRATFPWMVAATHAADAIANATVGWYPGTFTMDLTDACPTADVGHGPETWAQFRTRAILGSAYYGAADYDGVYLDVSEGGKTHLISPSLPGESIHSFAYGRADVALPADQYVAFDTAWNAGMVAMDEAILAGLPGGAPLLANGFIDSEHRNGSCFEGFPSGFWGSNASNWVETLFGPRRAYKGQLGGSVLDWTTNYPSRSPNLTNCLQYPTPRDSSADYQTMRFGLCTALLAGAYMAYDAGAVGAGEVNPWFDEYDVGLGDPVGDVGLAGGPLTTPDLFGGNGLPFTDGTGWLTRFTNGASGSVAYVDGVATVTITTVGLHDYDLGLRHAVSSVSAGDRLTLSFDGKASVPIPNFVTSLQEQDLDWSYYGGSRCDLTTEWKSFEIEVEIENPVVGTETTAALQFCLGWVAGSSVDLKNVRLQVGSRLGVYRRSFEKGVALVNVGDVSKTVNLGGTFQKLLGTQSPDVNDGSRVTSVTIPARDGLILRTAEIDFTTLKVTAPHLSLLVGSDALGWADLAGSAVIGERTKGMPGGDGSLSFTLPPDVAAKARNQLQHKARVKLRANGAPDFGGRICSDPFGDVLSPVKDTIPVECSGLWAWADRYGAFAWVWNDSDTAQWTTTSQICNEGASELIASDAEAAKYTADTQGRLFILANSNEAFAAASIFPLGYWLLGGLDTGCRVVGLDVTYQCNLPVLTADGTPGPWTLMFTAADSPWSSSFGWLNSPGETTTQTSWHNASFGISPGLNYRFVQAYLHRNSGNPGPINEVVSDPWVWVGSVIVRCRMDGETVDRTVYLSDVLRDMATKPGLATVTAGEVISLGAGNNQMAVRSMTSIRSGMVDLASLHAGELEYWFDLDAAGNDRFNHHEKPVAVDPARNSCWSYGEAPGEDIAGLSHDPEACPDWVRMTYLSDGVTTIPDGTPRDVWYPATPPTDYSASVRVITEFAGQMVTDAHAAYVAQRVHARIAASEWSGSVPVPFTMTDVAGRERGGWQVSHGDRISVPSLDGADDLYVTEAKWNWTTLTGSATVGYPWEVTGMLGTEAAVIAPFVDPNGKVDTAIVDTDPWKNWR